MSAAKSELQRYNWWHWLLIWLEITREAENSTTPPAMEDLELSKVSEITCDGRGVQCVPVCVRERFRWLPPLEAHRHYDLFLTTFPSILEALRLEES